MLLSRASGNEHLHRFLAIADGVVRAQGRKIVFSMDRQSHSLAELYQAARGTPPSSHRLRGARALA